MKITEQLADLVLAVDCGDLPERVIVAAECALIDHLGVGIFGAQQKWGRIVADHALRQARAFQGTAPLYGRTELLPVAAAARVNGTASHGFELDDLFEAGAIHPAAVVIPAAFASAVEQEATGDQLLSSIVAGYEAFGRIAVAAGSQLTAFHTTGTHGVFGSTAAVAKIAGFGTSELTNAWGVAASLAGGLKAFQSGGGSIKRLHAGRSAENGVLAVELTRSGLTGPSDVLENERGFFAAYGRDIDIGGIGEAAEQYVVEHVYYKPYASCGVTHPVINAIKEILAAVPFKPEEVRRVTVRTSRKGLAQNSIPTPSDTMTVQYSLQTAVALALLGAVDEPQSFEFERYLASPGPEIASRVWVVVDEEAESAHPAKLSGGVEIELRDGRRLSGFEPGLRKIADPRDRRTAVEAKFRRVTHGLLSERGQDTALATIGHLREGRSVAELVESVKLKPSALDTVESRRIVAGS